MNKLLLEEGFSKLYLLKGDAKLKYLDVLTQAEVWGKDHHNGYGMMSGQGSQPSQVLVIDSSPINRRVRTVRHINHYI